MTLNATCATRRGAVAISTNDDVVRDALERHRRSAAATDTAARQVAPALDDAADQELQRRLLEAGTISEIKPPITDPAPYRKRRAVPIRGEPVSEAIIRERR